MKSLRCLLTLSILFLTAEMIHSQSNSEALPFEEIPVAPENYTGGNVVARMVEGLGFRFHWASKDLREEDLAYKPSADARSCRETLEHIYGLSKTVYNASINAPNTGNEELSGWTYEALRTETLKLLKKASENYRGMYMHEVEKLKVIFSRGDSSSEYPFWNMINGPIADAIYHTGQLVTFRRSTGNPIDANISQFTGKKRN